MCVRTNLTFKQARQIDMVDYLASLGYTPKKIKKDDYWYHSPLRNERTASFKINRKKNVWYDHGSGQGGNLVDFGLLFHKCSITELLSKLNEMFSFHPPKQIESVSAPAESSIQLLSERKIVSLSLLRYLKQRRIAESIAKKYCCEISFSTNGKAYTAIGFKNDLGGFELRNQWYKGSIAPKAVTSIGNSNKELAVFEGFFDFLSYQTINLNQPTSAFNFLILNSTSFFEKSREYMEQHDRIRLFLDSDKTGQNCRAQALSWSLKYKDDSSLYKGYKDLNDWIQHIGKSVKNGLGKSI
jgi:DNA primase